MGTLPARGQRQPPCTSPAPANVCTEERPGACDLRAHPCGLCPPHPHPQHRPPQVRVRMRPEAPTFLPGWGHRPEGRSVSRLNRDSGVGACPTTSPGRICPCHTQARAWRPSQGGSACPPWGDMARSEGTGGHRGLSMAWEACLAEHQLSPVWSGRPPGCGALACGSSAARDLYVDMAMLCFQSEAPQNMLQGCDQS